MATDFNMCALRCDERGRMIRTPTALVDLYHRYIAMPVEESVGPLASPEAEARIRAVLAPAAS